MMRKIALFCALVLLVSPVAAGYPILNTYVTDTASLFSANERANLNERLAMIDWNTTVEIAILTVTDTNGEDVIMYANHVGDANGVGKAAPDNGVVIVWSLDNIHGGAIATGRGIESTLTDATASRIGRGAEPYFDNDQYYLGFQYIITEIDSVIEPQVAQTPSPIVETSFPVIITIIAIAGVGLILWQKEEE